MSKGGKFSLLLGMATGAVTSLLFAPGKGDELRKRIVQERKKGGLGHKAVVDDLTHMAEDIGRLVGAVAKSDEAHKFWLKTNEAVNELTSGNVDLDEWVKEAHAKADQFKRVVSRYAETHRPKMQKAKKAARGAILEAKKVAKVVRRKAKKVAASKMKKGRKKAMVKKTSRKGS